MRQSHPKEGLKRLCALFGVTRQAYYAILNESGKKIFMKKVAEIGEKMSEIYEKMKQVSPT